MGVPGLWDLLRPAATRTSLSTLAREAFYHNKNGRRALTIGIDASIWIFHAQLPQYGENPFMRTIFFKITSLLQHPVLPVFVFDGPKKPSQKRGTKVAGQFGTSDYRSRQFKELLDACGLEWWNAPGEAEAELALMNRQGKIDVVLSDDVDALLFGATCLLRNNSPTLSGAQASSTQSNSSKPDLRHYEMYRSSAIVKQWTDKEGTSLRTEEDCRMAMVWIALLGGGDYAPEGLTGFGPTITYALANAGMADFLHRYKAGRPINEIDVAKVHALMIDELRTNASGHLGRRYPARAAELQVKDPLTLFPAFALDAYLRPATSSDDPSQGWPGFGNGEAVFKKRGKARSEGRGDMESFAKACEKFFEWGTKDLVPKKFASESVGLFGSELITCARERVRLRDPAPSKAKAKSVDQEDIPRDSHITSFFQSTSGSSRSISRPNKPRKSFQDMPAHVIKIHSSRPDPTNPDLKELRISFTSTAYIKRCHDVMDGHRVDPKDLEESERANLGLVGKDDADDKVDAPTQKAEVRLWIAEYLVQEAWPELIKAHEEELAAKARPKPKAKKVVKKGTKVKGGENTAAFKSFFTQTQRPPTSQRAETPEEEEEPLEHRPSASRDSTLTPPPPSSPLPSRERIKRNVRRSPPSSSTASVSSSRPPNSSGMQSHSGKEPTPTAIPPRRGPRRSARFSKQAKSNNDIIDLCSSEDDDDLTPPPPAPMTRRPLASTSRTNASPAPISRVNASPARTAKSKPKPKLKGNESQSLLALPPIKPISTLVTEPTREKEKPKEMKKRKEKSPLYLVTYEDDNVVEIDVRGRWARGESVGVWEDM